MPRRLSNLDPTAKPFTFSGSTTPAVNQYPNAPPQSASAPATIPSSVRSKRSFEGVESEEDNDYEEGSQLQDPSLPVTPNAQTDFGSPSGSATRGRRPPIPDFRHPISTKTVPASVFKALASADSDGVSRTTAPTSINPRERPHAGSPRGSLDDLDIPSIAHRPLDRVKSTDDEAGSPFSSVMGDVFTQSPQHGLLDFSYDRIRASHGNSGRLSTRGDDDSVSFRGVPERESLRKALSPGALFETDIVGMLEEKFDALRSELAEIRAHSSDSTEIRAALSDFIPFLRTTLNSQLAEHRIFIVNERVNDTHADFDHERIEKLIEDGHDELRASLQRDIAELNQLMEHQTSSHTVFPLIESMHSEIIKAVNLSMAQIMGQLEVGEDSEARRAEERQKLLQEIVQGLTPHISSLRHEPLNIDFLTAQVAQAVKPNISQLIDLASDKKQTAELILKELKPTLDELSIPMDKLFSIASQITSDVHSAIAHADQRSMDLKESVADLVVERLDTRLANRDNSAANLEELASRISASLGPSLDHSAKLSAAQDVVSSHITNLLAKHGELQAAQDDVSSRLLPLPDMLIGVSKAIAEATTELVAQTQAVNELHALREMTSQYAELQVKMTSAHELISELHSQNARLTSRVKEVEDAWGKDSSMLARSSATLSSQEAELSEANRKIASLRDSLESVTSRLGFAEAALSDKERLLADKQGEQDSLQRANKELEVKVSTTILFCYPPENQANSPNSS
jgi:hypothetical protein